MDETSKPEPRRSGGYLFLPQSLQRNDILIWLRRGHAWTGIYGAVFFFVLGLTGFYLNHRTAILHIDGGTTKEVAAVTVPVEPGVITDDASLEAWMREAVKASGNFAPPRGRPPSGTVQFNGEEMDQPVTLMLSARGPNATLSAEYVVGANMVSVKQSSPSMLKFFIDLHKVIGVGSLFVLLMDTMAGAMMFMSLSGVLLWTKLHGPRLLAAGLVGGMLVLTVVALNQTWVGWSQ